MRDLIMEEVTSVSGGIVCTFGTSGFNCTAEWEYWEGIFSSAYEDAVGTVADFFMWIDEQFPDDEPAP